MARKPRGATTPATLTLATAARSSARPPRRNCKIAAATGDPEDQLRAPLERFITDLAILCGLPAEALTLVGETRLGDLKTRPDYAVAARNALAGFIELKAPGKGGDPRAFKGRDAAQWEKLQTLPNIIYTDGNEWSLWRYGKLEGDIERAFRMMQTKEDGMIKPLIVFAG